MQTYDLLMLVVLAGATAFGFWKGLAWQVASVASIFVSYVVAVRFRGTVAAAIDAEPPWNMFLAMLILYIGCSLVIWIGFRFVRKFINQMQLKEFDRQIGGLVGLGKGVLLCVIVTLFAVTLLGDERRRGIVNSTSGYYIAVLLDRSHSIMPPEVHEVLEPYIRNLDENHGQRHHGEPATPGSTPASSPGAPSPVFGGPLFGGNSAPPPAWPNSTTSEQGGFPRTSTLPNDGSPSLRDQLRSSQEAIKESIRNGQQQIRDQLQGQMRNEVQKGIDRYLPPPSNLPR